VTMKAQINIRLLGPLNAIKAAEKIIVKALGPQNVNVSPPSECYKWDRGKWRIYINTSVEVGGKR